MPAYLIDLAPSPSQLLGLGAVLLIAFLLVAIGAGASREDRLPEVQLLSGWAVVITIYTVLGAAGLRSFTLLAAVIAVAAAPMAVIRVRRRGADWLAEWWRLLLIASPLLVLATAMTPTQWDELTTWLPNARYLVEHDAFPGKGLPASPSYFPAYPYGLSLIIFFASRMTGNLVENAAALFNLLVYLGFGLFLARLATANALAQAPAGPRGAKIGTAPAGWGLVAFAALLATALNPTYVSRLVFSSYADASTGITVGFACAFTWMMLDALSRRDGREARSRAWQAGLALTVAVGLKQVNLVFLIALCLTAFWIALRDPDIGWRSACRLAPHIVVLPVIVYTAWRLHVGLHMPGGEFSFLPFAQWHFALIPDIVARMALVASKKGGYFGIMLVAVILAVPSVWRPRTDFQRLTLLTAGLFVAYNAFLLLTYVAAFGKSDALRAASYWRYNTHLGGVCLLFAVYALALLWRKFVVRPVPRFTATICVALVVVLPLVLSKKLRFDLDPGYGFARTTAIDLSRMLSKSDRVLLVDPLEDGGYMVIMRYNLHGSAIVAGEIRAWNQPTPQSIRDAVTASAVSHIWIFSPEPVVTRALNMTLPPGNAYLLARGSDGWSVVEKWVHPKARLKASAPAKAL